MSSNQQHNVSYPRTRSRRRMLDLDLNVLPVGSHSEEGTSDHIRSQSRQPGAAVPAPIDIEAADDDVIISSPRAFAEAKNNAQRNRDRTVVVDLVDDRPSNRNKRRRGPANPLIINCDGCINSEGSSPRQPPPKEPTFSCPICMGPLVEEYSTKCGHIFCKACIKAAITAQGKCPTCRRRTTAKDIIRVYLPSTTS